MPIELEGTIRAEGLEVARQMEVAEEVEMMVEAASQTVGAEEVMQAQSVLMTGGAYQVRSCRLMKRRPVTYRSRLATMVASPPYVHQIL